MEVDLDPKTESGAHGHNWELTRNGVVIKKERFLEGSLDLYIHNCSGGGEPRLIQPHPATLFLQDLQEVLDSAGAGGGIQKLQVPYDQNSPAPTLGLKRATNSDGCSAYVFSSVQRIARKEKIVDGATPTIAVA